MEICAIFANQVKVQHTHTHTTKNITSDVPKKKGLQSLPFFHHHACITKPA